MECIQDGGGASTQGQERHDRGRQFAQARQKGAGNRTTFALMIGIDTNVLVRFLVRDDEAQFERARRLI